MKLFSGCFFPDPMGRKINMPGTQFRATMTTYVLKQQKWGPSRDMRLLAGTIFSEALKFCDGFLSAPHPHHPLLGGGVKCKLNPGEVVQCASKTYGAVKNTLNSVESIRQSKPPLHFMGVKCTIKTCGAQFRQPRQPSVH